MKAITVALALVALAYGQNDERCTPGSSKMIECNHCWCVGDGSGWACTLKGCNTQVFTLLPKEDSPSEPEAADLSERSRRDAESPEKIPEDSKSIENIHVCEPGATKNVDCNSCFCINDGSGWACTQMGCNTQVLTLLPKEDSPSEPEAADPSKRSRRDAESPEKSPEDSKSIENIHVCEPGATKNVDCNSCFCINDGSGWACTKMGCDDRIVVVADSGSPDTTAAQA